MVSVVSLVGVSESSIDAIGIPVHCQHTHTCSLFSVNTHIPVHLHAMPIAMQVDCGNVHMYFMLMSTGAQSVMRCG